MIELNIAAITETTAEKATRQKEEERYQRELDRWAPIVHEEYIRRYPHSPAARKARKEKADREFMESIRLDNALPKITVADSLRPGWRGWGPPGLAEKERKAAEEKAWKESREVGEIVPIPEAEF